MRLFARDGKGGSLRTKSMSEMGQKYPKRLRLPAHTNTHEHMGRIVPKEDLPVPAPQENVPGATMVAFDQSRRSGRGAWACPSRSLGPLGGLSE
jgi:hypothetical protein